MSLFRRAGALIARFFESSADPAAAANEFKLYSKDAAGVSQLYGRSDDGTVHQITPSAGGGIAIGDTISGANANSVLFVGALNTLAQDNANLYWNRVNKFLGIGSGGAPAVVLDVRGQVNEALSLMANLINTGSSGIDFYDNGLTRQGGIAYANQFWVRNTHTRLLLYLFSEGPDWVFANSTGNMMRFGMTAGSTFQEFANGSGAAVSAPNTCRVIWNNGTDTLQISKSGAAYVDII